MSTQKGRLVLYGEPATKEEIAKEIARLLLGDPAINQKPLSKTEVADSLSLHRVTVYRYIDLAVELKLLSLDAEGNPILPQQSEEEVFQKFSENHPITSDHLVKKWEEDLKTRKQGGQVETYRTRIRSLESVCNTLKIRPKSLIISRTQTEDYVKKFIQFYREGKIEGTKLNRSGIRLLKKIEIVCERNGLSLTMVESLKRKLEDDQKRREETRIKTKAYVISQGIRDFCGFYGITWKRGVGGIMSQRVVGAGKYADVKLTSEQLRLATEYILKKWGLDSDVYRWFWIGIESCSRFNALFTMDLDYSIHTSHDGNVTYLMKAYESKTKHLKGGMWTKYITKAETQKSITLLRERHGIKIYDINATEEKFQKEKFTKQMNLNMIEIFLYLGITNLYFYEHTNHVLRHIGAHYWLALLDYDYGRVALIGGWHTIDELRRSYGEMPPEKLLEGIDKGAFTN